MKSSLPNEYIKALSLEESIIKAAIDCAICLFIQDGFKITRKVKPALVAVQAIYSIYFAQPTNKNNFA